MLGWMFILEYDFIFIMPINIGYTMMLHNAIMLYSCIMIIGL
jgi:hypothetical protein